MPLKSFMTEKDDADREVKSCDLKAAAIKTYWHKHVKTHQSLFFCWGKNALTYSVGHKTNREGRLTTRDQYCSSGTICFSGWG